MLRNVKDKLAELNVKCITQLFTLCTQLNETSIVNFKRHSFKSLLARDKDG